MSARLSRARHPARAPAVAAPAIVRDVLRTPGQPLDDVTLVPLGSRFGHDFSRVRIHADGRAAESARAVHALAYTVGHHVAFASGQFAPTTTRGRRLIAHELAHVVEQSGAVAGAARPEVGAPADDAAERTADAAADAVLTGTRRPALSPSARAARLQRQADPSSRPRSRPALDYRRAARGNRRAAAPNALGWATKLESIAGGRFKPWADLWKAGDVEAFADAVATFQTEQGFRGRKVDGVLGLGTWALIGGLGEAMAGLETVQGARAREVCTLATKERIQRGHKLATGEAFSLPEDRDARTYNVILQTIEGRMLDIDAQYRGTGAAGALVYAGLGTFVPEADIWTGALRPGAAIQVWKHRSAFELLKAGQIEVKGKTRRITAKDANFHGTSVVFVRYDTADPTRMLVRHFDTEEWMKKSSWDVWVAANATGPVAGAESADD